MGVGKTTFTLSNTEIGVDGGYTNVNLTRDNQSYTNILRHGYGDVYTFPNGVTDYKWTPTAAQLTKFWEEVPAQKTRLIDVYLDTYNGNTKVGCDVHSLSVTLLSDTGKPTISSFSITDANTTANGMGIIIDGKSKLSVSKTVAAKYGAYIDKTTYQAIKNASGTQTVAARSSDIDSLIAALPLTTTPTSYKIYLYASDSRGFNANGYVTKTIAKYQAPHIDTFEVIRCDTSGNENDDGTKAKVIIKGTWAAMKVGTAYKNPATLKVGYKATTATSYTYQTITVTGGTVNISQLLSATLTAGTDYEFSVQLADKFETYSEDGINPSNVKNILYVSADGNDLVIGSDANNNVLIDPNGVSVRNGSTVNATFAKNKIELGKNSTDSIISLCGGKGDLRVNDSGAIELHSTNASQIYASSSDGTEIYANAGANGITVSGRIAQAYLFADAYTGDDEDKSAGVSVYASSKSSDARSGVSLYGDTINLNNETLSDFVVAQGASGIWHYRKWNSGIAEIWGRQKVSGYGTVDSPSISYPFTLAELLLKIVGVIYSSGNKGVYILAGGGNNTSNTDTGVYMVCQDVKDTSSNQVSHVQYFIMGRWK